MNNNILINIGVICFIVFCFFFARYTNQQTSLKLKETLQSNEREDFELFTSFQ